MKRLRVVSYAINGRGMGHLVRQLAILRWVRRIVALLDLRCECWVLTSSEADTLARREGVPALKMPSKAMLRDAGIEPARHLSIARGWVLNAIVGLQPDLLLVDTFPGGSFGELVAALELAPHRVLVARRVREEFAAGDAYRALLPLYERVIVPDDRDTGPILIREREELLDRDQARAALGIPGGRRAVYVTFGCGADVTAASALPPLVDRLRDRGWHVVVGAGPLYQGVERRGEGITWLDRYVAMELFPGLDAAVSAGGYNAFHELMFAGVPTVFLPQPRIADDQMERVRRAEEAGAGRVARRLEDVADLLEVPGDPEQARRLVPANGARAAALAALATVLPEADLTMAGRVLTSELVGALGRCAAGVTGGPSKALDLVRLLSGGTPSELARRRAVVLELADQGYDMPELDDASQDPGPTVRRFLELCETHDVSFDTAMLLVQALARKFPAADGDDLLAAVEILFPLWARFDDWMGAVSLLRAVPTQRGYGVRALATDLAAWLENEEELFDALRRFSRLEAAGQRTVAEVLRILMDEASANRSAGTPKEGGNAGALEAAIAAPKELL